MPSKYTNDEYYRSFEENRQRLELERLRIERDRIERNRMIPGRPSLYSNYSGLYPNDDPVLSESPYYKCRICGKANMGLAIERIPIRLCGTCAKNIFERFIEKELEGKPDICKTCKSHFSACTCRGQEQLRKLKK